MNIYCYSIRRTKLNKHPFSFLQIRAQASVLKRAVLEEQNKNAGLRENLRNKETALRKVEHEVDSLGFRNKQLEYRVESLQEDLSANNKKGKSRTAGSSNNKIVRSSENIYGNEHESDPILSEEFQKKILENANLASTVSLT